MTVTAPPLLPLTRFRQCRGKQSRWNCDDPQTDNQHKEGEYFATDSHRSDITVAHGRQVDDAPPEGMEDLQDQAVTISEHREELVNYKNNDMPPGAKAVHKRF